MLNSGFLIFISYQSLSGHCSGAFVPHAFVQCGFESVWIWKGLKEKNMRSFKRYVDEVLYVIMIFLHAKAAH